MLNRISKTDWGWHIQEADMPAGTNIIGEFIEQCKVDDSVAKDLG